MSDTVSTKGETRYTAVGIGVRLVVAVLTIFGGYQIVWRLTTDVLDEFGVNQTGQRIFWHSLASFSVVAIFVIGIAVKRLWDLLRDNPHVCVSDEQYAQVIEQFAREVLPKARIRRSCTLHLALGFGAKISLLDRARDELYKVFEKQLHYLAVEITRQKEFDASAIRMLCLKTVSIEKQIERFEKSVGKRLGFTSALTHPSSDIQDRIIRERYAVSGVLMELKSLLCDPPPTWTTNPADVQRFMVKQGELLMSSSRNIKTIGGDLAECIEMCRAQCHGLSEWWLTKWTN